MLCPIIFPGKMLLYLTVLLIRLTDHGLLADTTQGKTITPCQQKKVQDIGVRSRLTSCGETIDCGDSHVIVVRNVTNDESLVESFQNVCNHNNSCDLAVVTDKRECEVEYYCLNDTFSDTCAHEYFSGIYMNIFLSDDPLPQCYRTDGERSMGDCSFYPPDVPRNNWLLLQASLPVSISQESNVTEKMELFRNYNFPLNHKTSPPNHGIRFNCQATIWLLYVVSTSCDENFDAVFKELEESDIVPSPSMYTLPSDDGTHYNSVSSTSASLGVANTENGKGNRWMSSRDFILKVTAGIAGGLTLLTFSVCVSVLYKKSSKKTPAATLPSPPDPVTDTDFYNCTPLEAKLPSEDADGEAMYFVIEPEKHHQTEEENTYNSIDELLPKIHPENTTMHLYSPIRQWDHADKTVSTIIEEDMYDQIPEDTIQGNTSQEFNTRGSRSSDFSQSSWRRKPCNSYQGSICEDTKSNVPLIPNSAEEWSATPSNSLRKLCGSYDTILQKNPSVPQIDTDSESDSDAIYEQVDELCQKNSGYYGRVQPPVQDIYESVDDSPTKMGRCSTFLPARNEKKFPLQKNNDFSLLNNDSNIQNDPEGIYDHLNENSDRKSSRFSHNINDGHIYAHLGDNFS